MLDLHGYTAPVDQYGGLYQIASDLNRNNAANAKAKDDAKASKASMAQFLINYTNPKDHLSGSPYDPIVTKGYSDILEQGTKLMSENPNMTTDMLLTALSPAVSKLSEYSDKAKVINQNINDRIKAVPENSGYDKLNLEMSAKKNAFLDDKGQLKDISTIDPTVDYVTQTVKNNPADVTNNKGLDEWLKGQTRLVNQTKVTNYNNKGGRVSNDVKTNAYDWAVPEVDPNGVHTRKFVPAYDEATDNGQPLLHDFPDGKGGKTTAPVRMVKDNLFKTIMGNSPGTADWVRGQVMQHIKDYKDADGNPVDINSPQAHNIAKAILYDELKTRGLGGMEDIVLTKPTQIKNETNVYNAKDVPVNDLYKSILDATKNADIVLPDGTKATRMNTVPADAQREIFGNLVKDKALDERNTFIINDNGNLKLYRTTPNEKNDNGIPVKDEKYLITTIPYIGTNVDANKRLGQKSVQKAVIQAQGKGNNTIKKGKYD